ncbi:2,3-bisphosphoglycerate-independent phosphoglycerate mutase [bacterium]|nr:2,3-bisphosphoglycerate-independent phosphoglycerate mutase [bacterium]
MFEELLSSLAIKNENKIVLLVMDGVGDLPVNGKTPLEAARAPNLDRLASEASCGLLNIVYYGITAGSGPGHLALFGYDPIIYQIGRGVLEVLGVDMEMKKGDLAARGNFATIENGLITDRRAGRISTEKNRELVDIIKNNIQKIEDVEVIIKSGKEHRFAVIFRGSDLHEPLSDADPQQTGLKPAPAKAHEPSAKKAERIINKFIDEVTELLASEKPANTVLMRGFANYPAIKTLKERFELNCAAVATYPMYRGLARLVGMNILPTGETIEDEFNTVRENYGDFDYFFVHVKKTDSRGEDGNFEGKVKEIEKVDKALPMLTDLNPSVLAVTADHSTPCKLAAHSWHPTPVLIHGKYAFTDDAKKFSERECAKGILGRIPGTALISLLMANSLKFKKFGA